MSEAKSISKGRRAVAVLASLVVPGGGQLALGRYRRAITLLLVYVSLVGLGVLCGLRFLLLGGILAAALIRLGGAIEVAFLSPAPQLPGWGRILGLWAALSALLSIGSYGIRKQVLESFRIPSGTMIPSIQSGDYLFVDKLVRTPRRGEIFVFTLPDGPGKDFIKRVIGIPGDRIEVCGYGPSLADSTVRINDTELPRQRLEGSCEYEDFDEETPFESGRSRPCIAYRESSSTQSYTVVYSPRSEEAPLSRECRSYLVPADSAFVLGDNRDNSYDSRFWNFGSYVPYRLLKGKAWFIWWSSGPAGVRWKRVFSLLHEAAP